MELFVETVPAFPYNCKIEKIQEKEFGQNGWCKLYVCIYIYMDATVYLQLEASCLQWSFFTCNRVWELFCLHFERFYLQLELLCLQVKLFAYSGKVLLLISCSMDCKQRTSTVSEKAPTVSKKLPCVYLVHLGWCFLGVGGLPSLESGPFSMVLIPGLLPFWVLLEGGSETQK